MQYSEIKTMFTGILNRRDITASQITTFMGLGAQFCSRKLRVPFMETLLPHTTDGTRNIPVPADFLEIIAIYVDDTTNGSDKLERRDLQTVLRYAATAGTPKYYCRVGANFVVGPVPAEDQTIYVNYYATPATLVDDTDTNWLTENAPTALVYSALLYAADYYLDDRKKAFADTLAMDLMDVQENYTREEFNNASITPLYPDQTEAL